MRANGDTEALGFLPNRVELGFVQELATEIRQNLDADHAQLLNRPSDFGPGGLGVLHGNHGDTFEAVGVGFAVCGQPVVIGDGDRHPQAGVFD